MLTPFLPAAIPQDRLTTAYWLAQGMSERDAQVTVDSLARERVFMNNVYQVSVRDCGEPHDGWPRMIHLSIKRRDRRLVRDWRQVQWIKNQLVGPEHEAVELFPAESRLVDSANQYHLWVLAEAGVRFPFGFADRLVSGRDDVVIGSKQRPFTQPTNGT